MNNKQIAANRLNDAARVKGRLKTSREVAQRLTATIDDEIERQAKFYLTMLCCGGAIGLLIVAFVAWRFMA